MRESGSFNETTAQPAALPQTLREKDAYFLGIAKAVSKAATCSRAQHGAIVVVRGVQVSSGYNGAPRGLRHCDHSLRPIMATETPIGMAVGGPFNGQFVIENDTAQGRCVRAVHAEANVIINAAREGHSVLGGTMYVTGPPCIRCAPILINAGIVRVVYTGTYAGPIGIPILEEAGIKVEYLSE